MKNIIGALFMISLFVLPLQTFSQRPSIAWQKCIGGSGNDAAEDILIDNDGSYIAVGYSNSNNGDFTDHHGSVDSADGWIAKIDPAGNFIWKHSVGGTGVDSLHTIIRTTDGAYLCVGNTSSNDGDVSGNHGKSDIWLLKISAAGSIVWSRCYGGSKSDIGSDATLTPDGALAVIGSSNSSDGNVLSGTLNRTDYDGWVFKTDLTAGSVLWERCFNMAATFGTYIGKDNFGFNIMVSEDNNLYATITDNYWGVYNAQLIDTINHTRANLFKLNLQNGSGAAIGSVPATGTSGWPTLDSNSGYDYSMCRAASGYYISAPISFYEDLEHCYMEALGYSLKPFGSNAIPQPTLISDIGSFCWGFGSSDGYGYYGRLHGIAGLDNSFIGAGHKYYKSPSGFYNWEDALLNYPQSYLHYNDAIYTNDIYGGTLNDRFNSIKVFPSGNEYIVAGQTESTDGDVSGNHGARDAWVVRISGMNKIRGTVFADLNNNNIQDPGEPPFNNGVVRIQPNNRQAVPDNNGDYLTIVDTGSFNSSVYVNNPYYTVTPPNHTSTFTGYQQSDTVNFAVHPQPNAKDYMVSVGMYEIARPGFQVNYRLDYRNKGTTSSPTTMLRFIKDSRLSYDGASISASQVNGDTIWFSIANLQPFNSGMINIHFTVAAPPIVNNSDTLHSSVLIDSTGDLTPIDNYRDIRQIVFGSYDPNFKQESLGGYITTDQLAKGEFLEYTIGFQNTGTDTAFNITLRDTLDTKLNSDSIMFISSSHQCTMNVKDGRYLTFVFPLIKLADSLHNEPLSHGYVNYRIKPAAGLVVDDTIKNRASIYFDFNLPVETNTQLTIVRSTASPVPVKLNRFTAEVQNTSSLLKWSTSQEINSKQFDIEFSIDGKNFNMVAVVKAAGYAELQKNYSYLHTTPVIGKNYYRLKMIDLDGRFSYSEIRVLVFDGKELLLSIHPNPADEAISVTIMTNEKGNAVIKISDLSGRSVLKTTRTITNGINNIPIAITNLSPGEYIIEVQSGKKRTSTKFIKSASR